MLLTAVDSAPVPSCQLLSVGIDPPCFRSTSQPIPHGPSGCMWPSHTQCEDLGATERWVTRAKAHTGATGGSEVGFAPSGEAHHPVA